MNPIPLGWFLDTCLGIGAISFSPLIERECLIVGKQNIPLDDHFPVRKITSVDYIRCN